MAAPPDPSQSTECRAGARLGTGDLADAREKKATEQQTVVWIDEASVALLPFAVRTFAPKGQTPVLCVPLSHDHLAVISALSDQGQLWFAIQSHAFDSQAIVAFLQTLLDQIPGKLVVIWDGAPIHRSKVVKAFLAAGAAHRLHLERLPGYAPDLNPDEGVWQLLKRVELRNQCYANLTDLHTAVEAAMHHLQEHPHRLLGCLHECAYLA